VGAEKFGEPVCETEIAATSLPEFVIVTIRVPLL